MYNEGLAMYNGSMPKTAFKEFAMSLSKGFTLLEILVAIAIMGIIGLFTLSNFTSFGEEQKLKSSASDIQSFLKVAQSNSTTGVKCQNDTALGWLVEIPNSTTLELKCTNSGGTSSVLKTLALSGIIQIEGITPCIFPAAPPISLTFAPLSGIVTSNCGPPGDVIEVTLKSDKVGGTIRSKVKIESGGAISVYMQ